MIVWLVVIGIILAIFSIARSGKRAARNTLRLACPTCGHEVLPAARTCPHCLNRIYRGWAARRHRLWTR
jgi:hypothetical protein